MVMNLGLWISPFCLPKVSTVVLERSLPQRKDICAGSRGSWKTHQPLENHGREGTAPRGIISTVKMIGRSRAALTAGFINSGGQTWTWGKQEVLLLRAILNLAKVLELWRGKHELFSHYFCDSIIFVTPNPVFHPAAASQSRFLGMCPKTRGCWFVFRIGRREEKLVLKHHCPHKSTCEFLPTAIMAPPQPSRVFPCFS